MCTFVNIHLMRKMCTSTFLNMKIYGKKENIPNLTTPQPQTTEPLKYKTSFFLEVVII